MADINHPNKHKFCEFQCWNYSPPGGRFGLGELQHLDVLLSGYRGLGEPRSGNGVPNLQRREDLWLCYRIALRALPRVIISVPWGKYVFAGLQRIFRCCCLPTDCSRDSWEVVAVKLRHDAHLSASSHLFGMPGLWKARCLCVFHYNISSKLLPVIGKYARHGGVTWFIHTLWIWSTVRLGPRGRFICWCCKSVYGILEWSFDMAWCARSDLSGYNREP
ncbi:hypothetical protein EVAR_72988_1, partial [Eumeta japonica]